jgi:RHS repeat-associated protein
MTIKPIPILRPLGVCAVVLRVGLLWLTVVVAASSAIAASCPVNGGAPGPLPDAPDTGLGAMAPAASAIGGRSPADFVAILAGAAPQPPARACARGGGPNEPASLPPSGPGRAAGNPVDLVSGNKYAVAVDLLLADVESGLSEALRQSLGGDAEQAMGDAWQPFAPLRLLFSRHYNSRFEHAGPLGPGWRHGFETALARLKDARGISIQVVQADARRIHFRPVAGSRPGSRASPRRIVRYQGDSPADGTIEEDAEREWPWIWRWPDGRELSFDSHGRLARIQAADRDVLGLHRDPAGRLQRITDSSRRSLWLEYAGPRLAALVLPGGGRIHYEYDSHGVLMAARYPDGRSERYHYEDPQALHLLTGVESTPGRRSQYRYDDNRRVIESVSADGLGAIRLEWRLPLAPGEPGQTTVSEGDLVSVWQWALTANDASGETSLRLVSGERCTRCPPVAVPDVRAGAPERRLDLDRFGLPAEARLSGWAPRSDARQPVTMHLRLHRHPSGPLAGKLQWVERLAPDGSARRTVFHHDERRRLVGIERAGLLTRIERDEPGRPVAQSGPDRRPLRRVFDSHGRLVDWQSGDARTRVAWNRQGLPDSIDWPSGERWSLAWHGGRVVIESSQGWRASGDAQPAASRTDPPAASGVAVGLAFADPHHRVIDAAGRQTERRYDDFGRLIEERYAGGLRRFGHDAWGAVVAIESADGAHEQRQYDAAGRLRVRVQSRADEHVETRFDWDGALLVAIDHPMQRTRVEYDDTGRVVTVTDTVGRIDHRWRLERDQRGRIVGRGLPDGSRLAYRFDDSGLALSLDFIAADGRSVRIVERSPDRAGRSAGLTYGNGVRFEREDDETGRPTVWRWLGLDRLPQWQFHWRVDGLPGEIMDERGTRRFGWDALGRLAVVEHDRVPERDASGQEYFAWTLAGDLLFARRRDGSDWRASGERLERDAGGRSVRLRDLELRYGAQGRVIEARRAGEAGGPQAPLLARYAYNAAGERILKRTAEGVTGFLYRGHALAAETGEDGRILRHYLHWQGRPVAIVDLAGDRPGVYWLHGDHLGTPHAATDASGRPVWRADYQAFGALAGGQGWLRQPLRFPGQYHDTETGLHDNYLRGYDPVAARYLEPDPAGLAAGLNPWAYADGNPLLATDPLGLILFAFDGTMSGAGAANPDALTNVRKFFELYNGERWYMTGVGLDDPDSGIRTNLRDALDANTARARVDYMLGRLMAHLEAAGPGEIIDIDVIGYSRGAAMARDFVNRAADLDARFAADPRGVCLNLRFLGLWDTVAQFGVNGSANAQWRLGIPSAVGAAYHAVALNEHRSLFPLEAARGATVIQRGFVGDHADIGGGNRHGDLSDITLAWMAAMAAGRGVELEPLPERLRIVDAPLVHDRNYDRRGDRRVDVRDEAGRVVDRRSQRDTSFEGMRWAQSRRFIGPAGGGWRERLRQPGVTGRVDIEAYSAWLSEQYGIRVVTR